LADAYENVCLKKIVIPGYVIRDIQLDLQNYGIDDTTIFPDLEGLGRTLITTYRNTRNDRPHRGVYVRLRPSKIHQGGVGVFAIKRIPRNTKLFTDENEEVCWMSKESLPKSGSMRKMYDDFAIIKGARYGCPTSFNGLTPAWFLNESKKPNIRCDENYDFYTLRDIPPGEELTVDYSTFSDYPEDYLQR
jgi:SET domain